MADRRLTRLGHIRRVTGELPNDAPFFIRDHMGNLLWVSRLEIADGNVIAELIPDPAQRRFHSFQICRDCRHLVWDNDLQQGTCMLNIAPELACCRWTARMAKAV